jgi:hypothetical protein
MRDGYKSSARCRGRAWPAAPGRNVAPVVVGPLDRLVPGCPRPLVPAIRPEDLVCARTFGGRRSCRFVLLPGPYSCRPVLLPARTPADPYSCQPARIRADLGGDEERAPDRARGQAAPRLPPTGRRRPRRRPRRSARREGTIMSLDRPDGAGPRRVLLLGATGTIGRATARALAARGHAVVCLVRRPAGPALSSVRWPPCNPAARRTSARPRPCPPVPGPEPLRLASGR